MANAILTALQGLKTQNVTAASLLRTAIIVALYLVLGIVVYIYILEERKGDERWTTIDTLYFSMVTMSTVGYGDFSPSTPASRAFTVFYILLGVTHVCLEGAALLCSHLPCSALTAYRRSTRACGARAASCLEPRGRGETRGVMPMRSSSREGGLSLHRCSAHTAGTCSARSPQRRQG